jgi:hypothetical protein
MVRELVGCNSRHSQHQPGDHASADLDALALELSGHAFGTVRRIRRVDLHDPHRQLPLAECPRLPAALGADPPVEAAPIRDQYPAQPFDAEPATQTFDERKPPPGGSAVDQGLGRLTQNLILGPKTLDLTALAANLVA